MTWHNWWQSNFADTEVAHPRRPGGVKDRRADAVIHDGCTVLEFQHSRISRHEVHARNADYALHSKRVLWVVDGTASVRATYLPVADAYLLHFDETWMYDSFQSASTRIESSRVVFLDCDVDDPVTGARQRLVFRFAPASVKHCMLDVKWRMPLDRFVELLKNSCEDARSVVLDERPEPVEPCDLFLCQRGAGSGKTYESIQLLTNDSRFSHKTTFLYLTKLHTAKSVIRDEFEDQVRDGKLDVVADSHSMQTRGKQYRIRFERALDGETITVIIGTIDSFMYALGDRHAANHGTGDYFERLRRSIQDGFKGYDRKDGTFSWNAMLNRKCLLIIDEAQDLKSSYIEAVAAIMRGACVDAYVIGDKMQSIWGGDNVFTQLSAPTINGEDGDACGGGPLPNVRLVSSGLTNVVRRFRDQALADFVNACVPFDKYGLPSISLPGDLVAAESPGVHLFNQIRIGSNTKEAVAASFVEDVLGKVDAEVENHGYLPHDFLFVFPIMKGNVVAARLESRLNEYWIRRMKDPEYKTLACRKSAYWRNQLSGAEEAFHQYAVLHRSEEDKPINLDESRHATRLLSIHASKGMGREVVFVLNMTDDVLMRFSNYTRDLVYESLLHVALTRCKRSMYVGVPDDTTDELHKRFTCGGTKEIDAIGALRFPSESVKIEDAVAFVSNQSDWCKRVDAEYYVPAGLHSRLPQDCPGGGAIVDWGHHVVRHHVMRYTVLYAAGIQTGCDVGHLNAVLHEFARARVETKGSRDYYKALYNISHAKKHDALWKSPIVPVLAFEGATKHSKYAQYCNALCAYVLHIQRKILDNGARPPVLCPIEMCVFVHAHRVLQHGKYTDVPIMEVYNVMHSMAMLGVQHECDYGCLCSTHLATGVRPGDANEEESDALAAMRSSVSNHHLATGRVTQLFARAVEYIRYTLKDTAPLKFNVDMNLTFVGNPHGGAFKLYDQSVAMIGSTSDNVVLFALQPSFSRMNRDEVFAKALFNTFIARNPPHDRESVQRRLAGKRVSVCVITFDNDAPVWLHLDGPRADGEENTEVVPWNDRVVRDCLADMMASRFHKSNESLWERFSECLSACPAGRIGPAFTRMAEILSDSDGKVPEYATRFFEDARIQSQKDGRCSVTGPKDIHYALGDCVRAWLIREDEW